MAQNLEIVIDLLKEIKRVNGINSENFDRLLAGINSKLDIVDRNTISEDLLKSYIAELAKTFSNQYNTTFDKFADVEKALRAIYNVQNEHVKNTEIKEVFETFSKNVNNIYTETRQQKSFMASIETRLTEFINNKTDKEDIIRNVNLLKKDFEALNKDYKSNVDILNDNVKLLMSVLLNDDNTSVRGKIKTQFKHISSAISDLTEYLKNIETKESQLETVINNLATSESLKLTNEIIGEMHNQLEDISEKVISLPTIKDIEQIENDISSVNKKMNNTITSDLFISVSDRTDSIISQTEQLKKSLADLTSNISNIPSTKYFENIVLNLFKDIKELSKEVNQAVIQGTAVEVDMKLKSLTDELSTIREIVTDVNDVVTSKVLAVIQNISFEKECYELKNQISKMLETLPQKEDLDRVVQNSYSVRDSVDSLVASSNEIIDKLDNLATHSDIVELKDTQTNVVEQLQDIAQKNDLQNIESKIDNLAEDINTKNYDKEFNNIYSKTASIESWLENSNVKENTEKILNKISKDSNKAGIQAILETTEKIVNNINELSENADAKKVNRTVSELYNLIEDLKNDFLNTTEIHNDQIIVNLAELQSKLESIVSVTDFDTFVDNLKDFIGNLLENQKSSLENTLEIKSYQETIIDKLNSIQFNKFDNYIEKTSEDIAKINSYIEKVENIDLISVERDIQNIKEMIANSYNNATNSKTKEEVLDEIKKYFETLKDILIEANTEKNSNIEEQIVDLEQLLVDYKTSNETTLSELIYTIQKDIQNSSDSVLDSSKNEITDLKQQISNLINNINSEDTDSCKSEICKFLSEKFTEINSNLTTLSESVDKKLQTKFNYTAQLLDEKAESLIDFIKKYRKNTKSTSDIAALNNSEQILSDFKQELEFLHTDVIDDMNANTTKVIELLSTLKEEFINEKGIVATEQISKNIDVLHESIMNELIETKACSTASLDRLDDLYNKINAALLNQITEIKTFILNDVNTIVSKIDTVKDNLSSSIDAINNDILSKLEEINTFKNDLETFSKNNSAHLDTAVKNINETLSAKFKKQRDEIKSIIELNLNYNEIIESINNLKDLLQTEKQNKDGNNLSKQNEYEAVFSSFSKELKSLSGNNQKLTALLAELNENIGLSNEKFNMMNAIELIQKDLTALHDKYTNIDFDANNNIDVDNLSDNVISKITKYINPSNLFQNTKEYIEDSSNVIIDKLTNIDKNIENLPNIQDIEDIKMSLQNIDEKCISNDTDTDSEISSILQRLDSKVDIIAANDIGEELNNDIEDIKYLLSEKLSQLKTKDVDESILDNINVKISELVSSNDENIKTHFAQIKQILQEQIDALALSSEDEILESLSKLNQKIDIIVENSNDDFNEDLDIVKDVLSNKIDNLIEITEPQKVTGLLEKLNNKIDIIAENNNEDFNEDLDIVKDILSNKIDDLIKTTDSQKVVDLLEKLNNKLDIIVENNNEGFNEDLDIVKDLLSSKLDNLIETTESQKVTGLIERLNNKIDIIVENDNEEILDSLDDLKDSVNSSNSILNSDISTLLDDLNNKIDIIAEKDNDEINEDLHEIKKLIYRQIYSLENIETPDQKEIIQSCLTEINKGFDKINPIDSIQTIKDSLHELKESIMTALVSTFEQVSFSEESENIKDFVEAKTEKINASLLEVTNQLKQIVSDNSNQSYTYSMQDIESDLAKLRLALNSIKDNENTSAQITHLNSILEHVNIIGESVAKLQNAIPEDEFLNLKIGFDSINNDIQNLSSLTNQVAENSDKLITNMKETLYSKFDKVTSLLEASSNSDKVMRQALIYIGEWIDSATSSMNHIKTNSSEIIEVKSTINDLKQVIPNEIVDVRTSINELKTMLPSQTKTLDLLVDQFDKQQLRIDRLEMTMDKILSSIDDINDSKVSRKIDRLDKQLSKISIDLEKLTAYVD